MAQDIHLTLAILGKHGFYINELDLLGHEQCHEKGLDMHFSSKIMKISREREHH